jgi:HTH-type transcriptional regulator / antitoxin HigA
MSSQRSIPTRNPRSSTDADYQRLVALLDNLVDLVGEDEDHLLAWLMEVVGVLVERYEDEHAPELSS